MGESRTRKKLGLPFKEKSIDEKKSERLNAQVEAEMLDHKKVISENLKEVCGPDGWVWCLHCGRAYRQEEIRYDQDSDLFMCAYPDCDGDALTDAFSYERKEECGISGKQNHPEYPAVPEKGKVYPLY